MKSRMARWSQWRGTGTNPDATALVIATLLASLGFLRGPVQVDAAATAAIGVPIPLPVLGPEPGPDVAADAAYDNSTSNGERAPLVVLLLDGFRWDYLRYLDLDAHAGGFQEFLNGASASFVTTVFPSTSYPAWTTISTGLYPEDHGILANFFYNRQRRVQFALTNPALTRKPFWWQSSEPVWTTATKSGLNVATILWSRSDVPVRGVKPEEAQGYEQRPDSLAELQSTLIRTVDYLGRGFDLVMAYNEYVDVIGHEYGPESNEMKFAISDIDKYLAEFFASLKERNMYGKVNIILLSDHGMTSVLPNAVIDLEKILATEDDIEESLVQGPFVAVYARAGRVENIMSNLRKVDGISAYRRGEVPEFLHYNKHPWLPDIIICAKKGYSIKGSSTGSSTAELKEVGPLGLHGYSPVERDMRTIFLATGPDFKTNTKGKALQLVDEYQVFCHLLRIRARPHNGSWERVRELLRGDPTHAFGEDPPVYTQTSTTTTTTTTTTFTAELPTTVSQTSLATSTASTALVNRLEETRSPVEETTHEELTHVSEQRPPASRNKIVRQNSRAATLQSSFLVSIISVIGWFFIHRPAVIPH